MSRFAAGVQLMLKKGVVTNLSANVEVFTCWDGTSYPSLEIRCDTTSKKWYLEEMSLSFTMGSLEKTEEWWFAHGNKSIGKWFEQSYDASSKVLTLQVKSKKNKPTGTMLILSLIHI